MTRQGLSLRMFAPWLFALWSCGAGAAPPDGLDQRVEQLIAGHGVPGMSVAIVERGEVVHARGYGRLGLENDAPVDADTLFMTGSTGKAKTAAALAILVDEGRIGWDDRVIDHLPEFRMYDPWVTREITVRDLLVHRSGLGLGAGDLLFVPRSNRSRAETVHRLRYLKPATSFRSGYAYDNVLYVVAGAVIEAVGGQRWEDFVRERLLRPAGMLASTTEDQARWANPNRALPHARLDGGLRGLGRQQPLDERRPLGANAAPAGGIAASANDMARWLQVQLGEGRLPGAGDDDARLFSAAAAREMWTPQVLIPVQRQPGELAELTPNFSAYALGWSVRDYRGVRILEHGGAVLGMQALVVLIPDREVGFSLHVNAEEGQVLRGLGAELIDHYLDAPPRDWVSAYAAVRAARAEAALERLAEPQARVRGTRPSLAPAAYAGTYRDDWYGPIRLEWDGRALRVDFLQTPDMQGRLEHWHHDTFRVHWDDTTIEPADMSFSLDADGRVERITMRASSPLADFSYNYHDLLFVPGEAEPGAQ